MSDAEEALAQRWWPLIRRELRPPTSRGGGKASSAWTALLLGGDLGMLGVKLAQAYPRGMVLSLRPRGTHSARRITSCSSSSDCEITCLAARRSALLCWLR